MWEAEWAGRGVPWEYDAGPPRNRSWGRLFAETPNYRGLGRAVTRGEAFRWHFGPMFYRGRLWDGQARVLVVGQEGAQDESLAHRSFVGGTGGRMQYVLQHLGITRSYLFVNTFVYPIFGQYINDPRLQVLAQHPDSPIRRHREQLFGYVAARHDLRLVIAVGTAAKETVAAWIQAHGGAADPGRLHEAEAHRVLPGLRAVGVRHPGGAAQGGELTAIVSDFRAAMGRIERWTAQDPGWLPPDPDGEREPADGYRYRSARIPFRDLAYGTAWRLGRGATSSNRRDGQTGIQLFSADGSYNNQGHSLTYSGPALGSDDGYVDQPGDRAYEPPRAGWRAFDPGPGAALGRLLQGGHPRWPWPDFGALGSRSHPSLGVGPGYRGRLAGPALLVVADQASHDDLFTGRALTGDAGQHLQALLAAAGLTESYAIVRTLPVDTLDEPAARVRSAVDHPAVRALHSELLARVGPQVVLTVGVHAQRLVAALSPPVPVVAMRAYRRPGWLSSWRQALATLEGLQYRRDVGAATFVYDGGRQQIPRGDLPWGFLRWQATSGDRAARAIQAGGPARFNYYKLVMPDWAAQLPADGLSVAEQRAADVLTAHLASPDGT